jgi:hypothetical protein
MKMAGWLSPPNIPDRDECGFPRILSADQEPATRDDAAISPRARLGSSRQASAAASFPSFIRVPRLWQLVIFEAAFHAPGRIHGA